MDRSSVRRYSEAFKLEVVSELESGGLRNITEAMDKYGIGGFDTVRHWLKKYGKAHLLPRIVRVESVKEIDRIKQLKKENDQLKKALADTHLDASLYKAWFEIACKEFGVKDTEAFKKKLEKKR